LWWCFVVGRSGGGGVGDICDGDDFFVNGGVDGVGGGGGVGVGRVGCFDVDDGCSDVVVCGVDCADDCGSNNNGGGDDGVDVGCGCDGGGNVGDRGFIVGVVGDVLAGFVGGFGSCVVDGPSSCVVVGGDELLVRVVVVLLVVVLLVVFLWWCF